MPAHVDIRDDHLIIRLDGLDGVAALRRTILVPFSTIQGADCEAPAWPKLGDVRLGAHVPGQVAIGSFKERGSDGRRRFLDIARGTERALRITLEGHSDFDEIEVATEQPERVVSEVARHRPESVARPPVYE